MASVFQKYPNLPGFVTEFKDGGLQVRREPTPPGTESVLLIGTALDGPIGEPVAVDATTVEEIFGKAVDANGSFNGATLVKGFYEAYQAGCRDIRLLRATGSTSKAYLKGKTISRSVEKTVTDQLGLAPGNKEQTLTLSTHVIDENSLIVQVNGYELAKGTSYILVNGAEGAEKAKIVLARDIVDPNLPIQVTYRDKNGNVVTENGELNTNGQFKQWLTEGVEIQFSLSQSAKPDAFYLYADGVEVARKKYKLTDGNKRVIIEAGALKKGAQIEANYINAEMMSEKPEIKLESMFGGSVYNQTQLFIEEIKDSNHKVIGKKIILKKPASKKQQMAEKDMEFTSTQYPTLRLLVQAINEHPDNNIVRATVSNRFAEVKTFDLNEVVGFSGGSDGLNPTKKEMYEILGGKRDGDGNLVEPGIYHLLENYKVDIIVPLGVYADDVLPGKYDNFAYQLALACAVISYQNSATMGVIATSSPDEAGLLAVQQHVEKLLASKNDYFMRDRSGNILKDQDGNPIDLGRYIQVVAGPDLVLGNLRFGSYADNSPASYAGFLSALAPQSSPTNKVMPFVRGLRFSYSNAQLDKLTQARYVTYMYKNNGQNIGVVDAPTAAQPTSDYRRVSTLRAIKSAINRVRQVSDPFLGDPIETPQRNALSAAIAKELDRATEAGEIMAYDFNIVATEEMKLMNEIMVELTIVPPQELRRITVVVNLRRQIQ